MDFHKVGPWLHAEMLPESKASLLRVPSIQTGAFANQRVLPIGAHNPAAVNLAGCKGDFGSTDSPDAGSPNSVHSRCLSSRHQGRVQGGPANSPSVTLGKNSLHRLPFTDEADANKRNRLSGAERDAKVLQRRNRLRH